MAKNIVVDEGRRSASNFKSCFNSGSSLDISTEVVAEFGPLRGPRRRDSEERVASMRRGTLSTTINAKIHTGCARYEFTHGMSTDTLAWRFEFMSRRKIRRHTLWWSRGPTRREIFLTWRPRTGAIESSVVREAAAPRNELGVDEVRKLARGANQSRERAARSF